MTVWVAYADGGSGAGLTTGEERQGNVVTKEQYSTGPDGFLYEDT